MGAMVLLASHRQNATHAREPHLRRGDRFPWITEHAASQCGEGERGRIRVNHAGYVESAWRLQDQESAEQKGGGGRQQAIACAVGRTK
jgi:hypothetical protein